MKPITREWIKKAQGDFTTANRELRARKAPNYDASCFHSQQCAEKYLKACLQETQIPFEKTHNLILLLELILPRKPEWEILRPALQALNAYAIEVRYPGESANKEMAGKTLTLCKQIRERIRLSLGLKP